MKIFRFSRDGKKRKACCPLRRRGSGGKKNTGHKNNLSQTRDKMLRRILAANSRRCVRHVSPQLRLVHTTTNNASTSTKPRRRSRKSSAEDGKLLQESSKLAQQLKALESLTKQVQETIKQKESEKVRETVTKETSVGVLGETAVDEKGIDEVFKALGIQEVAGESSDSANPALAIEESELVHNKEKNDDKRQQSTAIDINSEKELLSLFPVPKAYVSLPPSVSSVLTPEVLSNITQEETANWEPVIDALLASSICHPLEAAADNTAQQEFTGYDFHQLVSTIPRKQKKSVVEKLHELALVSGVLWGNVHVMNDLLALCNMLPNDKAKLLVEALLQDIDLKRDEGEEAEGTEEDGKVVANVTTKAILLNHYARLSDVGKVREYIAELNKLPDTKNPMKTSPVIYTSIMQMYMRLDNYELAKATFDTMKFLSLATSPSPRTYTSMILLDTLHNNIEHGITVYDEMLEKEVKMEPEALLALAKGCGARRGMIDQGWQFIIEYYEKGFPVDSQVMEIMMYLAYVDGDLPFVRGIWMNICETNTKLHGQIELPHAKCTKWLFNTYYKVGDIVEQARNGTSHVPVGLRDSRVRSIRTKVLELANFSFHEKAPPLLPMVDFDGADPKLMMGEARALWKYLLETTTTTAGSQRYVGEALVEAYLYVVGRYASLETFEREFSRLTVYDGDNGDDSEVSVTIEEPEADEEVQVEEVKNEQERRIAMQAPDAIPLGRFPRTDRLYNMCMHTARHQASLSFAQRIWTERGRYRQSSRFQALSVAEQDAADFKFARLMLSVFTHTGNVGDAYKLVLSSQNRFVWSRYHLKSLLTLCERLGYTTFAKELIRVVRRGNKWVRRQQRQAQAA